MFTHLLGDCFQNLLHEDLRGLFHDAFMGEVLRHKLSQLRDFAGDLWHWRDRHMEHDSFNAELLRHNLNHNRDFYKHGHNLRYDWFLDALLAQN